VPSSTPSSRLSSADAAYCCTLDAIFLNLLDADARPLEPINLLVDALPDGERVPFRHVDLPA
jgi:hypothetical protein